MKTIKNQILITGGSAGIGFEIAKAFLEKGNEVIIVGRNKARLDQAAARLPGSIPITADITDAQQVNALVARLTMEFPKLNVLVNNAGAAFKYDLTEEGVNAFDKAGAEMLTNYLSVIRLTEQLLPQLKKQPEAAIVNVSSVVAFVPGLLATYSASKAALHSYTQSLRLQLAENDALQVFELMPPLVDTAFSAPIGGKNGIPPSQVAEELLTGMENDSFEIRVGQTEQIYQLFLSNPGEALRRMNQQRKAVLD